MDDEQLIADMATLKNDVKRLREGLDDIRKQLESLAAIASFGKGALWAVFKVGAIATAAVAGIAFLLGWRP